MKKKPKEDWLDEETKKDIKISLRQAADKRPRIPKTLYVDVTHFRRQTVLATGQERCSECKSMAEHYVRKDGQRWAEYKLVKRVR